MGLPASADYRSLWGAMGLGRAILPVMKPQVNSMVRNSLWISLPMHAAWVRTQLQRSASAVEKASGQSVLTVRELDILKWIYLGKSNFEIGAILKISPLTVKNHVQKILRKLNVVNRTQAIGKSLELRILNP